MLWMLAHVSNSYIGIQLYCVLDVPLQSEQNTLRGLGCRLSGRSRAVHWLPLGCTWNWTCQTGGRSVSPVKMITECHTLRYYYEVFHFPCIFWPPFSWVEHFLGVVYAGITFRVRIRIIQQTRLPITNEIITRRSMLRYKGKLQYHFWRNWGRSQNEHVLSCDKVSWFNLALFLWKKGVNIALTTKWD